MVGQGRRKTWVCVQGCGFSSLIPTLSTRSPLPAVGDCSPAVPLLVPTFSLFKQSKLEKRGIFTKVAPSFSACCMAWGRLWGCFPSLRSVPPWGRKVGHSCPFPLVNGGQCFAVLGEKLISAPSAHSQPTYAHAEPAGPLLSAAVRTGHR